MNGEMSFEVACSRCGSAVATPKVNDALLDERGTAHVACACGAEVLIPLPSPPEIGVLAGGLTTLRNALCAIVVWLLILGMVLLLVPVYDRPAHVEPAPQQIELA